MVTMTGMVMAAATRKGTTPRLIWNVLHEQVEGVVEGRKKHLQDETVIATAGRTMNMGTMSDISIKSSASQPETWWKSR